MTTRHLTTAVTLVVLCVVLVVGAVVGFNALFAPLPGSSAGSADPSPSCAPAPKRLRTSDVTVSVFNAGNRAGLAGDTLDDLTKRGFKPGVAGNAPTGAKVFRAQVWMQKGEEDAARLVALQLGPKTPIIKGKQNLGEGIDVVVADGFRRLLPAPRSVKVTDATTICS